MYESNRKHELLLRLGQKLQDQHPTKVKFMARKYDDIREEYRSSISTWQQLIDLLDAMWMFSSQGDVDTFTKRMENLDILPNDKVISILKEIKEVIKSHGLRMYLSAETATPETPENEMATVGTSEHVTETVTETEHPERAEQDNIGAQDVITVVTPDLH